MKLACLILAAGASRRMGERNKLLLQVHGKSFVRTVAEEMAKLPFSETLLVTGFESEKVASEVESLAVTFVHNPSYQNGLHSSIRAGVAKLSPDVAGFAICFADQPLLRSATVKMLFDKFELLAEPCLVFPVRGEKHGHPVIISNHFRGEILDEPDGDYGCRYLFKRHPEAQVPIPVDDDAVILDVDTPDQYAKLLERI